VTKAIALNPEHPQWYPDPQIEHIADGLRNAGLAIEPASRPS
jgi:hypothetical protein